jgi:hypothetical protein
MNVKTGYCLTYFLFFSNAPVGKSYASVMKGTCVSSESGVVCPKWEKLKASLPPGWVTEVV